MCVHDCIVIIIYTLDCHDIAAGQEQWQPLLRPSFLETLWQKLVCLWQNLGFLPEAASAAAQASFANYIQSGSYPDHRGKHNRQRQGRL